MTTANAGFLFLSKVPLRFSVAAFRGTVGVTSSASSSGKVTYKSFMFRNPDIVETVDGEGSESRDNIAKIEVAISKARAGPPPEESRGPKEGNWAGKPGGASTVSEKESNKKGLGVGLAGDGKMIILKAEKVMSTSTCLTRLPDFGIQVYVRDQDWLIRRNIIDSEGKAFKEAVSTDELAKVEKPRARAAAPNSERPLKMTKPTKL